MKARNAKALRKVRRLLWYDWPVNFCPMLRNRLPDNLLSLRGTPVRFFA